MKIAIVGTRGIPNLYGGFEQFADFVSQEFIVKGHQVTVYCSHTHPFSAESYNGVRLIKKYDPEQTIGTAGQFIYDFNCIVHASRQDYDIVLLLGYTSSSIWQWILKFQSGKVITNMDGLEWKRSKFSPKVQKFLKFAERLAVKWSDAFVADSIGIQEYLRTTYNINSTYIAYGADVFNNASFLILEELKLKQFEYNMLVARLEPENNIEMILDGILESQDTKPFLVVGKHQTRYGEFLKSKYAHSEYIRFVGGIYDQNKLSSLRYYSNLYFHGHSVGGTNPSLLEAMGSNAFICAHSNIFNRAILGDDAYYFENSGDISKILKNCSLDFTMNSRSNNTQKIQKYYQWQLIAKQYLELFESYK